jgi:hypothetical protein
MDPPVSFPSTPFPFGIVLADMDADGRKDAVVVHENWMKLGVYRQFPSGDFLSEEVYPMANGHQRAAQALAVGDIDSDGRPDAVIADSTNGLVVLRHVHDTSLALAVTAPAGSGPYYVGLPVTARWTAGDTVPLAGFDLSVSSTGLSYTPIPECTGLPASATQCTWTLGLAGSSARVRVTARDTAGNTASAESIFNAVAPSINVTAPTTSQFVGVGTTTTIAWTHNLPTATTARVELSRDGGTTYETLADAVPIGGATSGSFAWAVTGPTTSTARVRVTSNGPLPASGVGNFAITTAPTLTVLTPSAGSTSYATSFGATWSSNAGNTGTVRIELSRDGGSTFETIVDSLANFGNFVGPIAGPGSTTARIRVTLSVPGAESVSATGPIFTLVQPTVVVTSPAAGATLFAGTSLPITWTSNVPVTGWGARIDVSRDGGSTYQFVNQSLSNTGRYDWIVPAPATSAAVVRVTLNGIGSAVGVSGTFAIVMQTVTVTSPAAGSTAYVGMSSPITWTTNFSTTGPVAVEISRDGGAFQLVGTSTTNTGSMPWVVTGPATGAARVRVTVSGLAPTSGTSGTFAIAAPSLAMTSPAAGAAFFAGTPVTIGWTSNLPASSPVTVELSRDGGATYAILATNAPNTGSFVWVATGPSTSAAVARVTISGPVSASAASGAFAIAVPSLTVTGPAGGASFYTGASLPITWSTNLPATSPVLVELTRDGGATFDVLAAAAPNTGSFAWVATGPDAAAVVARVTIAGPVALTGTSGAFAIATPSLTVTGPAAGTIVYGGTSLAITWTHNLPDVDPVSIELSRDGGATFEVLAAAAPNTGSFSWTVSGPAAAEARVRVTSGGAVVASGIGPAFSIVDPTLAVTAPAAGASWAIGTAQTIAWSSTNLPAGTTVLVALSRDAGASWTTLASAAPASGTQAWTATGPATSAAIVRVTANGGVPAAATSGTFTIADPALAVTSPAAGAKWTIGTAQAITWTTNLPPSGTVKVQISRNGGSTYTVLASAAPNTGSYAWTPTGSATTTAIVKVSANGFTATGVSGTFSLVAPTVTVTAPNTAVTWTRNTVHAITWNHNVGAGATFKIEVSRSGVWSVITTAATAGATSGSYNWTVTGPTTTSAKIRVTWNGPVAATDSSDASFRIN